MNDECSNCKFWRATLGKDRSDGVCRRYPPPQMDPLLIECLGEDEAITPDYFLQIQTWEYDWCGEHQPK